MKNIRYLIILLVSSVIVLSFSSYKKVVKTKFTVILDAGHGGNDFGSKSDWISEKDINLKIVQELRSLDKNPNIQLVYTRLNEQDISISERAEMVAMNHADLLISIHSNFSEQLSIPQDFKILVSKDSSDVKSKKYANILAESIKKMSLQTKVNFMESPTLLLKKSGVPSLMIELRIRETEADIKTQTNSKAIKKIAKSIYSGIEAIQNDH